MRFLLAFCALCATLLLLLHPELGQADGQAGRIGDEPAPLRALTTADDVQEWEAVGRIDTGLSFCTGTLIAPDLVLTAAHCLFTPDGARIPDDGISFQASLRLGRAEAVRGVRRSVVLPDYERPVGEVDVEAIALDIALLELDREIAEVRVRSIARIGEARALSAVTLVSYGTDREGFPSIEEGCRVLSAMNTVRVLSCTVVAGSSGAPVIRLGEDGPEIVAVVSGRASVAGQEVTVAVAATELMAELTAARASAAEVPRAGRTLPTVRRLGGGDSGRDTVGARFLRP